MKKIILLSTAAVLLSPIAAKANQKSSILIGAIPVTLERVATGSGDSEGAKSELKKFEGENYLSFGAEAYYTCKVWNNLQIAGGMRALYAPEHEFDAGKSLKKLQAAGVIEPRVLLGYEVPLGAKFTLTPFAGIGSEWSVYKKEAEWDAKWKLTSALGARFAYSNVYTAVAVRFDLTASDLPKGKLAEAPTCRNAGIEVSIGAEF